MGEHAHLSAMVGFMGNHIAEHFYANRPGFGPAISEKGFDVGCAAAECLVENFGAARCAFG